MVGIESRYGASLVNTKSWPFTPASWQAKQVLCCASSAGLPLTKRPKPQPPVAAYLRESLTMTWTVVAAPGMEAGPNSGD